jgi:hypothetical protein
MSGRMSADERRSGNPMDESDRIVRRALADFARARSRRAGEQQGGISASPAR